MATPLGRLVELCQALAATRARLVKLRLTAEFLRQVGPDEVRWAVAFLTGRPFPTSDSRVLDVAWATLGELRSGAGVEGVEPARSEGVEPTRSATSGAGPLLLGDVAAAFEAVAAARGPGSRQRKRQALGSLFARVTPDERDLLERIIHGEMRLGLQEGLLPEAIAAAAGVPAAAVRRALHFLSDPAVVARIALAEGEAGLLAVSVRVFVPLLPMLAEPVRDLVEALRIHGGRTALEFKYDGARIQLHKRGDEVRIWSRRLTEVTASLPEIVLFARREVGATEAILDGEVVAIDTAGRPLPFQELMRRFRRVHGIETSAESVPLALHFFDCLWVDGRALVDLPYEARWEILARLTGGRALARRLVTADAAVAAAFQAETLEAGHEGLVAKALASPYTPGTRGARWLKVKAPESVDCVIVAADRGSGRRRGWLSNYHLAVLDPAGGGFAPVGKTFKGLTDAEFAAMTARLRALAVADDGYTVTVRPEVVVEVAYNEIQRSPHYTSGMALRFARITRIRDDKAPGHATTLPELRALYERQFAAKGRSAAVSGAQEGDGV